jgi:two-component system sensor histidine kinase KdpD
MARPVNHSPDAAARLADRLNAPWYAVSIQTLAEDLARIVAATQRLIGKSLDLAQQLGAAPMTHRGWTWRAPPWPSRGNRVSR